MLGRQLFGQETGHRRFPAHPEHAPYGFTQHAGHIRHRKRHAGLHEGRISRAQQAIDDVADWHRLAVGNEIGLAGTGRAGLKMRQRLQMRLHHIVDVGAIHPVAAIADETQATGAGALHQAGQQLGIARAPDQPRAQSHRGEIRRVGGQHRTLGQHFTVRIMRGKIPGIRRVGFIAAGHRRASGVHHARGRGVHEAADAGGARFGQQHVGAGDIGAFEFLPGAPATGLGGVVQHRLHSGKCGTHFHGIIERAEHLCHAQRLQVFGEMPLQTDHGMALRQQAAA